MADKSASVPMMTFTVSLGLEGITLAYGLVCESKATRSLLALKRKLGRE